VASQNEQQSAELRSPISGRIRSLHAAPGSHVSAGAEVATVDPGDEQVWEALRALYLVGQPDDLPAIRPYQREVPEISDRIRQQALLTEKSIRERASAHP
jgi:multidrug efflux pump subunit AcrA (membrane-fusion protein)